MITEILDMFFLILPVHCRLTSAKKIHRLIIDFNSYRIKWILVWLSDFRFEVLGYPPFQGSSDPLYISS